MSPVGALTVCHYQSLGQQRKAHLSVVRAGDVKPPKSLLIFMS